VKSITVAVFALLAGALVLFNPEALAGDCCDDVSSRRYEIKNLATCSVPTARE